MPCEGLSIMGSSLGIEDILVFPVTCYYYFWAVILVTLFIILSYILYNREREDQVKPDLISILGISSTATLFLAVIGSLIKSTSGIVMIQQDILLYCVAVWIIFVSIWFFKK